MLHQTRDLQSENHPCQIGGSKVCTARISYWGIRFIDNTRQLVGVFRRQQIQPLSPMPMHGTVAFHRGVCQWSPEGISDPLLKIATLQWLPLKIPTKFPCGNNNYTQCILGIIEPAWIPPIQDWSRILLQSPLCRIHYVWFSNIVFLTAILSTFGLSWYLVGCTGVA